MEITVISNRSKHQWAYGDKNVFYIGRPSPLGNPYSHLSYVKNTIKTETVEEAVTQYEIWLRNEITKGNQQVISKLSEIYNWSKKHPVFLMCWCKDEIKPTNKDHACHADVVRQIIEEQYEIDNR